MNLPTFNHYAGTFGGSQELPCGSAKRNFMRSARADHEPCETDAAEVLVGAPQSAAHGYEREWGVPLHDDRKLFEFLVLEGAQAGLSWETVLRKRENYRKAFHNFAPRSIARIPTKMM